MTDLLNTHGPVIICELHTHLGETSDDVTSLLSSCGYTISHIKSTHIVAVKHISGDGRR